MNQCARCGADLPDTLRGGHCPSCLLRVTVEAGSRASDLEAPFQGVFGDYELLGEIARGGMGVVYRARQRSLNRNVAIKMLLAGEFASGDFVRRFKKEAEAAANLQHPNIVAIHDIGQQGGQYFFSMDLVDGRNLSDLIRDHPLPARRAAAYLRTIASAIAFAHDKGTLHRDLKPSNILIDCFDQPRITDFGLAREFRENAELTQTQAGLGSPAYMAPEQIMPALAPIGPAADIYSLGAVLYDLITGSPPFQGETLHQVIRRALEEEPIAPRILNPDIPPDLQTICLKCLEKDPGRRYGAAGELAEELGRFLAGEPILARPISALERGWRWCRRKPTVASLVATVSFLLILLLAGSLLAAWRIDLGRRAESRQRERATEANVQLAEVNRSLQESVTFLELQRAEQSFRSGDASMGLAQLAAVLRRDPTNHIAAERIISALLHRNWVLPIGEPLRHPSSVSSVTFSPDGKYFATACADGFVRIWVMRTREIIGKDLRHPARVRSVCFSPDGARLATACDDCKVRIWNWRGAELVAGPMLHDDWVFSVAFSPDGERVLSASRDHTARIWSARTGVLEQILRGHADAIQQAVFSPDGHWIATASYDHTARLWNSASGEAVGVPLRLFRSYVMMGVCFSPDGQRLATASRDGAVTIWNVGTGTAIFGPLRHPDGLNGVAFSPSGRTLVSVGFDNTIQLWDAQNGETVSQAFRHLEQVNQAAFSPDGRILATASDDSTVKFWDMRPGQMLAEQLRHNSTVNAAKFTRDGKRLATASYDGTARVWDVATAQPMTPLMQHKENVQDIAFSPDEEFVVTASGDGSAWIWNTRSGARVKGPFLHALGLWTASFSPDGKRLLTASADGTAKIWDVSSVRPIAPPLQHKDQVLMARFSSDGRRVATASRDHTARIWDADTGAAITESLVHSDQLLDVNFSPDGLRVATASADNTARIWNAATGKPIGQVLHHFRTVKTITFSHDGRRLVTASDDHTARVWDAMTGEPLTPPLEHDQIVLDASFSLDDQRVVTASLDRTARVWDPKTGLPLSEPLRHNNGLKIARFSPDGEKVMTGAFAADYPGHIWQVPESRSTVPGWLPALAEAVAGLPIRTRGISSPVSEGDFDKLREQVNASTEQERFNRIARWFFADRIERTISPFQVETSHEYVGRCVEENLFSGLEEAIRLDPGNSTALARLAKAILKGNPSADAKADAAHLARLALQLNSEQAEAREALAEIENAKVLKTGN